VSTGDHSSMHQARDDRPEFRVHMVAAMLGIAIALAMDHMFRPDVAFEWAHLIAFVAFAITTIMFTLAMMGVARDDQYWKYLAKHHAWAAYDLFSDISMGLVLIFMALNLGEVKPLLISNLALRVIDIAAEVLVVWPAEKDAGRKRDTAKAWAWLLVDGIAIVCLALAWWGTRAWSWRILEVSTVFLGFTVVDTLIDLKINSRFYFGLNPSEVSASSSRKEH